MAALTRSLLRSDATSYAIGGALALVVGALVLLALGTDPVEALDSLITGAFGSQYALGNTLTLATPIVLTGLAVVIPLEAKLLNVGGEGQLLVGALASVALALVLPEIAIVGAIVLLVAGGVAGALWAAVPGVGRARLGVNEVVATILLNFIALALVSWAVNHPIREEAGVYPQSDRVPDVFLLPDIGEQLRLHIGFFIALVAVPAVAFVLAKTITGYRLRITGSSDEVSRYLGLSRPRFVIGSMMAGGFLAGLAGAIQMLGVQGRLIEGFNPGYGFDGLVAAFLGGGRAVATAIAALVLGALRAGGAELEVQTQLPASAVVMLQAILIISTLVTRYGVARFRERQAFQQRLAEAAA
jgi:simple sugar transport system permease protein